ncbi:NAD(P)H-dependent oxidoreductase [Paenibacillus sp. SYP-B4298]|uniref:NAD(P)H-dependent oxidoreductase n=1 Tax=Paenibacillus sp. SYP-B4298 TaxID=2996034 RepID=UPI0022DE8022|nr:NAD(P)H-dependent oxidoreductase [Paenibacillus sp. SYP-B4298]
MKTLIIVSHPNIEDSVINKRWIEEIKKFPERYTVHELYKVYPDSIFDVEKEQKLIEAHGNLVLQFPIHWFNCPPILKKWLDDVLEYGWAYGSKGDHLKNRKVGLAVSAGIRVDKYGEEGKYRYSLKQLLAPFEATFLYCRADYRSFFAFYGTESEPGEHVPGTEVKTPVSKLERSAQDYLNFIDNL